MYMRQLKKPVHENNGPDPNPEQQSLRQEQQFTAGRELNVEIQNLSAIPRYLAAAKRLCVFCVAGTETEFNGDTETLPQHGCGLTSSHPIVEFWPGGEIGSSSAPGSRGGGN
jgi:hypothetical protein